RIALAARVGCRGDLARSTSLLDDPKMRPLFDDELDLGVDMTREDDEARRVRPHALVLGARHRDLGWAGDIAAFAQQGQSLAHWPTVDCRLVDVSEDRFRLGVANRIVLHQTARLALTRSRRLRSRRSRGEDSPGRAVAARRGRR